MDFPLIDQGFGEVFFHNSQSDLVLDHRFDHLVPHAVEKPRIGMPGEIFFWLPLPLVGVVVLIAEEVLGLYYDSGDTAQ